MIKEKLMFEILDEFEQAKTESERIAVLQKYDTHQFRHFLKNALDTTIEYDVEIPNYRPAPEPAGLNYSYLSMEMSKMYRFIKGHPSRPVGLTPKKQKQLLAVILESLHEKEAEILVNILQKKFKVNFLTQKLVQKALIGM
jgi:predicted metal-dependent hydrolase